MKYYELITISNGEAKILFKFYSLGQASKSLVEFAREFPNEEFFLAEGLGE